MERNREGRRGGNGTGNASSLSRRPRTSSGFKDVSEDEMAEENQNSRLQPRKDGLSSRKRRKRRGSQEAAPQQQQGRTVEMEECFDDAAEMAGSEDDDDLPPPTIRRRTGKLKINLKGHDDASSIDMAVVPRKLRTAMIKRYRDSTPPPPPPNAEILRQVSNVDVATRTPPASSNPAPLKPGRRTKPNSLKPRSVKLPKTSPSTISEQEAEVAETLYDLARMFSTQAMPSVPEVKTEADLETKLGPACVPSATASAMPSTAALPHSPISYPPSPPAGSGLVQSAASASSPSSTHTLGALGAPRRKRPRISSKSKDSGQVVGAIQLAVTANVSLATATLGVASESVDAKQVASVSFDRNQLQVENNTSPTAEPLAESMVASTAGSPSTSTNVLASPLSSHMPQAPDDSITPVDIVPIAKVDNHGSVEVGTNTSVLVDYKATVDNHGSVEVGTNTSVLVDYKATVANLVDSRSVADKGGGSVKSSVVCETLTLPEFANRLQQVSPVKSDCPSKFEIDLMAPPKSSDKIGDTSGSSMIDVKEKKEVDLATIPAVENSTLDVRSEENDLTNIDSGREDTQIIAKVEYDQCKELESNKSIEQLKETDDQSVYLKDRTKQEGAKQSPKGAATTMKTTAANGVPNRTSPLSVGMAGWPAGLSPLGYYSPAAAAAAAAAVAAAWQVPVPMTGTSSVGENNTTRQLPSLFLHTRQCWKRCATHVYITHFINSQQHVKHNPLFAAPYVDPTGFYGAKSYNINIPMVQADAMFRNGTGSDLMGTPVSGALEPVIRGPALSVGSLNTRGYEVAAVAAANELGPKDKANSYIDVPGRKPSLQQKIESTHQQPGLSLQGYSTAFGFPVTQSAAASAVGADTTGDNVGVSVAMSGGGSSTSLNSLSVDVENRQSNGSVANAAAVQAQLLHSVIQHPPFPFSFPPGQFGPLFSGHISPQQAAQYCSNNSFYGPHLMQPPSHGQQSQQASDFTSEANVSQRQQQQQEQHSYDISSFVSSGSAHQRHQQLVGTPGGALQHPDSLIKKEHAIVHGTSAAEMKPSVHLSIYGQNSQPLQASSGNFQSSILAACKPALPVQSHGLSAIAALGGKEAGKTHQQQVHSLLPSQQQSTIKLQDQHVSTQNLASSPALHVSLKDASASQLPATSTGLNKGSDVSLGLSATSSVMASSGHALFQNVGDTLRGLGQYQVSHNQLVSAQPHQFSVPGGQHQLQHPSQMHRAVLSVVENVKASQEESSYSSGGHREDRKSGGTHQLNQSNIGRVELEASANIPTSPTNDTSSLTSNTSLHINMMVPNSQGGTSMAFSASLPTQQCNQSSKQQMVRYKTTSSSDLSSAPTPAPAESTFVTFTDRMPPHPAAYCKIPPGQVLPFPGHTVALGNQGVKQGHTSQQIPQVKTPQQSAVGSALPASSASLPQAMLAAMAKSHGQQSRNRLAATNAVPVSRLSPATSASSPTATSLSPLLPATKAAGAATAKNALFVKDSYSLPQKSSSGTTLGKKVPPATPPNVASGLVSSPLVQHVPLKSSHTQLIQNQYNIQQQHPSYPLFHQAVQPMASAQQQPTVPQQYHLQQSPSTQQQALHFHKIFMQQNLQYVQTQSQLQSQVQAQQSTMHLRQATHQLKQQCGQMSSQSQQLGNAQRQHHEHPQQHQPIQSAPLTSFGIVANGVSAPTLSLGTVNAGTAGNVPRNVISDGAMISQSTTLRPSTPIKLKANESNTSPGFQRSNTSGPTFLLNQYGPSNSATSSQQQILSSNSSVSISYPNSASQLVSNSDTTGKLGDKQPTADIPNQAIKKASSARKAS